MPLQKQFTCKIFDQDGTTFLKNFVQIKNVPSFKSRLNGIYGECVLDLDLPFDNFDEGTSIDFMNIVKIYALTLDSATQTETLIYTGFISKYEPYIVGTGEEGVKVTLLSLGSLLSFSYYKNGSNFTVTHTTDDPETIGRAIIDHANTINGGSLLSYDNDTTDAVGQTVDVAFDDQKWFDALKKVGDLADTDWWWKIDEQGQYWLKDKPASATHAFTIGKDINSIRAPKDSEKVINDIQVRRSGGTATNYSDSDSQEAYGTGSGTPSGKRTKIINDTELTSADAADQRGNKEIEDNKDAKISATVEINDKYALETVKVGDTCEIRNFANANSFFSSNMMIAGVHYKGDTVVVDLERHSRDLGAELDSFVNG